LCFRREIDNDGSTVRTLRTSAAASGDILMICDVRYCVSPAHASSCVTLDPLGSTSRRSGEPVGTLSMRRAWNLPSVSQPRLEECPRLSAPEALPTGSSTLSAVNGPFA
jgi:hypothetical protein